MMQTIVNKTAKLDVVIFRGCNASWRIEATRRTSCMPKMLFAFWLICVRYWESLGELRKQYLDKWIFFQSDGKVLDSADYQWQLQYPESQWWFHQIRSVSGFELEEGKRHGLVTSPSILQTKLFCRVIFPFSWNRSRHLSATSHEIINCCVLIRVKWKVLWMWQS